MPVLIDDLRLSFRQLSRRPAFTITAVLTLAIGMGVNGVAFTVVNGVLLRRPPIRTTGDVGRIATTPGGEESGGYASVPEYVRFLDATRGSLDLAAEGRLSVAWRRDGAAETAWVLFVSSNYFSIVDARAIAGHVDVAQGAGGSVAAVVGERFWRAKLKAAPLAGLTLRLNNTDVAVAGVLPESFRGPAGLYSPDIWLPLGAVADFGTSPALQKRDHRWLFLFGRLRPGVRVPEVQGHVDAAVAAMAHDWPGSHRERGARFRLFSESNGELRALSAAAAVAMGIIGLVLLLACFNVANLLLARAVEREREMAIRAAMGAGASRLLRLVATDGFVIAGLAGAAALLLSWWTQALVGAFAIPIDQPQHIDLEPDATVAGFMLILVLIAGVLPGLWPALIAARIDVARVLASQGANYAGGRPSPLRRWLVGAQIAGSTAFLALAALFAQSFGHVSLADVGFAHDRLLVAELDPASHGYDANHSERYVEALRARVKALPGVVDVAAADRAPFFVGFDRLTPVAAPDSTCQAGGCPAFATLAVAPGYFKTLGVSLAAGREFEAGARSAEVIINGPLARLHWPDGRGVGETLRVGEGGTRVTVIGVTAPTRTRTLDREQPTLYIPLHGAHFEGGLTVVARTAVPPDVLVRPVLEAAHAIDENIPMSSLKPMHDRLAVQLWPFRTATWLFSICGILALVLGTVGLAGVVMHAVSRRLREFGLRVSLGATPRHLVVDVLRSSVSLLVPGVIVGTLLAAVAARVVQTAFVGVNVLNPVTYLAVAVLEGVVVLVACTRPALRASHVDPLAALRSE